VAERFLLISATVFGVIAPIGIVLWVLLTLWSMNG